MSHRIGECSACGAVFKLPASFAHDQARCTKCGGVVNIAPAGSDAPQPVPAKRVVQKSAPPVAPPKQAAAAPKPERSGPSMKEKILARKQAEAEAAQPKAKPKAAPAAPAARKPAGTRPAAPGIRAAAAKSAARPAAKVGTRTGAKAAAVAAPGARKSATGGAKAGTSGRTGGTERASSRAGGSRTRSSARGSRAAKGSEVVEGDVPYRDRVKAQRKKGSLVAGVVAVVLLVAAGGTGWWVTQKDQAPANAAGNDDVALAGSGVDTDAAGETSGDMLEANPDEGLTDETVGTEGMPSEDVEPDDAAAEGADDEAGSEPEAAKPAKSLKDPASVDLTVIEDFEPLPETSAEDWDSIRQDVADSFDLDAGASAGRARGRLEETGKAAFPAILNAFKNVDVTTETGHRVGDLMQKTLEKICNGNNFGWKYNDADNQHYFNKKVIVAWCSAWEGAKDDEAKWLKLSKQTGAAEEAPEEAPADDTGLDGDDFDFDD